MSTEGDDRPYKLMCMYRGPGPAYKLKGLLGKTDHCVTKQEAPAYTIGAPYKWVPNDTPAAYSYDSLLTDKGKQQAPSAPLGNRWKLRDPEVYKFPGPGMYQPRRLNYSPSCTLGEKSKSFPNLNPAPNQYKINRGIGTTNLMEKKTPEALVRSQTEVGSIYYNSKKQNVPSAFNYATTDPRKVYTASGEYTMKARVFAKEYNTAKEAPGPGAYSPNQPNQGKKYSMGIKHSEYQMPLITAGDRF